MKNIQNKPTSEEWINVINAMESQSNTPIEIKEEFSNYFFEHFLNCLPPLMYSNTYVLCSEPYSIDEFGRNTYSGIYKKNGITYGITTSKSEFIKKLTS